MPAVVVAPRRTRDASFESKGRRPRWVERRAAAHGVRQGLSAAALALGLLASAAQAQAASDPSPSRSTLDAPLFYQVLIGEMQMREGEPGAAYEVMLDAARRTRDEQLFRRATDIALEARAGEQALSAAKAWRAALPYSTEAHRYVIQILLALNRGKEIVEPLQSLLKLSPDIEQPQAIAAMPRLFGRATDRSEAGRVVEEVLTPYASSPGPNQLPALVSMGRAWFLSGDYDRALVLAEKAHALDPKDEGAPLLAIELMSHRQAAEPIVLQHLQTREKNSPIRVLYAQALAAAQRYPQAIAQLERITADSPDSPQAWLTLGALHLELRHPAEADAALQRFVTLMQAAPAGAQEAPGARDEAMTQAYLMLSQAAEQRGDFAAAEQWLGKVELSQRNLEVQTRRALLMARRGDVDRAVETIRSTPERTPQDARTKLLAEASLMRDLKRWSDAYRVLVRANGQYPDDPDLLYEQSMMAEKLTQLDEMERLLRRVIAIKPDHPHAYNALGYSLADRGQRLPEAKQLIEKALALSPGDPFITDSLGWVEHKLGNQQRAIELLRQAYAARPDVEIGAHLGEVLWLAGQQDEARRVWNESRQRDQANDVLRETLARLQVQL